MKNCSLWILVARTDVPFMMHTIPHLARMSNFPFEERVLAVDTAPLMGEKASRPGIGTMQQLRDCTEQLLKAGVVDRVVDINYDQDYRNQVYRTHFGSLIRFTHNYKGYPILGSIFPLEECKSDYMLHFDSDMMLYQKPGYSWVEEGMDLMQRHPNLMFVRPLAGPPTEDGTIYQSCPYEKDLDGFYKFKFFSSRVYLINRERFKQLLPLPKIWRSYRRQFINRLPVLMKTLYSNVTGKGSLDSWEIMVSRKLEQTDYVRGMLTNPNAWTLHPKERSPRFIQALPHIIERVEAGKYPAGQAGHYDFIPKLWLDSNLVSTSASGIVRVESVGIDS
jgi:hypothetical protein